MKRLLFILLLLPVSLFSQTLIDSIPFDESQNPRYEGIEEVDNTKEVLYNKGKIWMAEAFKDAKAVIRAEDKESGSIIGKGNVQYSFMYENITKKKRTGVPVTGNAAFTIKLFFLDGKYRYIIEDIIYNDNYMPSLTDRTMNKVYIEVAQKNNSLGDLNQFRAINNAIQGIIDDLTKKMESKAENEF